MRVARAVSPLEFSTQTLRSSTSLAFSSASVSLLRSTPLSCFSISSNLLFPFFALWSSSCSSATCSCSARASPALPDERADSFACICVLKLASSSAAAFFMDTDAAVREEASFILKMFSCAFKPSRWVCVSAPERLSKSSRDVRCNESNMGCSVCIFFPSGSRPSVSVTPCTSFCTASFIPLLLVTNASRKAAALDTSLPPEPPSRAMLVRHARRVQTRRSRAWLAKRPKNSALFSSAVASPSTKCCCSSSRSTQRAPEHLSAATRGDARQKSAPG